MKYFRTKLHYQPRPSEAITWLYAHKHTSRGSKEIKIGMCWHQQSTMLTHWFVWGARHSDNKWLKGEHERLHVSQ